MFAAGSLGAHWPFGRTDRDAEAHTFQLIGRLHVGCFKPH